MIKKICLIYKKEFEIYPIRINTAKFCSCECLYVFRKTLPAPIGAFKKGHIPWNKLHPECMRRGKNHPNYKGGKITDIRGYVFILNPSHPRVTRLKYVKRANLVMEKKIGRYLHPKEVVHHINGIKNDDRIENLKLFKNNSEHRKFHSTVNKFKNK